MSHYKKKLSQYLTIIKIQGLKEMNLLNRQASNKIKEQEVRKSHQTIILFLKQSVKERGVKSQLQRCFKIS